jgi:hypothetical protein
MAKLKEEIILFTTRANRRGDGKCTFNFSEYWISQNSIKEQQKFKGPRYAEMIPVKR